MVKKERGGCSAGYEWNYLETWTMLRYLLASFENQGNEKKGRMSGSIEK